MNVHHHNHNNTYCINTIITMIMIVPVQYIKQKSSMMAHAQFKFKNDIIIQKGAEETGEMYLYITQTCTTN